MFTEDRSSPPENLYRGVEETPGKGSQKIAPFEKTSPFWKRYERNELYNSGPESPHFNTLFDVDEDLREYSAIGMINTFDWLLEEVKSLQLDVSSDKLSSFSRYLAMLEKNGFDVAKPQSLICKVLFLQAELAKKVDILKSIGEKFEVDEMIRKNVEEEMAELERKSMELKRQEWAAKVKKDAVEERMAEMKSREETIIDEIEEIELKFQTTVSAAW